jgi:hypothetical protein
LTWDPVTTLSVLDPKFIRHVIFGGRGWTEILSEDARTAIWFDKVKARGAVFPFTLYIHSR